MVIAQEFSFKGGEDAITQHHASELADVRRTIENTSAVDALRKVSREKTMEGDLLFSPESLNKLLKGKLHPLGWATRSSNHKSGFKEPRLRFGRNQFREMDGLKNRVGLEIQFGKYAFMGYDIFSKMVIFNKKGLIDCGIEIVATREIAHQMSTGVSEFEQILIDFHHRGASDIDIPVLVLGLGLTDAERSGCLTKVQAFRGDPKGMVERGEVDTPRGGALPGPK